MRKILVFLSFIVSSFLLIGIAQAEKPEPTKKDAIAMVNKAIAFVNANGREKGLVEISKTGGQFVDGELYVFVYDMTGKVLAHGGNPIMIGKDLSQIRDQNGVKFVEQRIAIAKSPAGEGWQDYDFLNPKKGAVEPKTAYIKKSENMIFGAGIYRLKK